MSNLRRGVERERVSDGSVEAASAGRRDRPGMGRPRGSESWATRGCLRTPTAAAEARRPGGRGGSSVLLDRGEGSEQRHLLLLLVRHDVPPGEHRLLISATPPEPATPARASAPTRATRTAPPATTATPAPPRAPASPGFAPEPPRSPALPKTTVTPLGACDPANGACTNPLKPYGTTCSGGTCIAGARTPSSEPPPIEPRAGCGCGAGAGLLLLGLLRHPAPPAALIRACRATA